MLAKRRNYKKYLPISGEIAHEVLLPMLNEAADAYLESRRRRDEAFDALEATEQNVKRLTDALYAEIVRC